LKPTLTEEVDAEIAGNKQNNDDHTDDGEDVHAALISLQSGELRVHYAFTLVGVIRPAHWTLGKVSVERLEMKDISSLAARSQSSRAKPPTLEEGPLVHLRPDGITSIAARRAERGQNQIPDNPHVRSITDRSDLRSTTAGRAASLGSCEGYDSMRTTGLLVSRGISPVLEGRGHAPHPTGSGSTSREFLSVPVRFSTADAARDERGRRRKRIANRLFFDGDRAAPGNADVQRWPGNAGGRHAPRGGRS